MYYKKIIVQEFGAIVWKRVGSSVVESGSSMTTTNVCTQQKEVTPEGNSNMPVLCSAIATFAPPDRAASAIGHVGRLHRQLRTVSTLTCIEQTMNGWDKWTGAQLNGHTNRWRNVTISQAAWQSNNISIMNTDRASTSSSSLGDAASAEREAL